MYHGISTKAFVERFILKVATTLICVVVADFLMFDQDIGWTIGLFGLIVLSAVFIHNHQFLKSRLAIILAALVSGQCMLLVERSSVLSFLLAFSGLIVLAIATKCNIGDNKRAVFSYFKNMMFSGSIILAVKKASARKRPTTSFGNLVRGWALPVGLSIVFLVFFFNANPILANYVGAIDLNFISDFMKPGRWFVWLLVGIPTFHLIRFRIKARKAKKEVRKLSSANLFYSKGAVIRSLIAFNIIFLFQTFSDAIYLWGGWSLPEGITYAEYAHKGAYPLIATALLAGIFVILTSRAGKDVSTNIWVTRLIYFWLGQNIALVFSSIFRTALYVEHYSLTYLRIAALIWMVLVAGGLLVLIIRLMHDRSENWLFNRLYILLFSVLYLATIPNYAAFIANYNYMHSQQVSGNGTPLDVYYLRTLSWDGEVIPVFDLIVNDGRFTLDDRHLALTILREQYRYLEEGNKNWRSWTFRDHRLENRLRRTDIKSRVLPVDGVSGWQYEN